MKTNRLLVAFIAIVVVSILVGCGNRGGDDSALTGLNPVLLGCIPRNGETNVATSTSISCSYSLPISISSVSSSTFTCSSGAYTLGMSYSVDATGTIVTVSPSGGLFSGAQHTCAVSSFTGTNGLPTVGTYRWSFTTAGIPGGGDTTAPSVVSVTTSDGKNLLAGGVMVGPADTLVVRFNEGMDTGRTSGVSIRQSGGATISSTTTASGREFYVTGSMSYNLSYELVVSGARDSAGNVMADYVLSFKTFPYYVAFWIVNSSPVNGATVSKDEVVWAKFNNPANISYLTTMNFAIGGAAYMLSLSSDGLTAYATPTAAGWPAGSRTVSLSNIRDTTGNIMAPTFWNFTSTGSSSSSPFTSWNSNQTVAPGATVNFSLTGASSGLVCTVVNSPAVVTPVITYNSTGAVVSLTTSSSATGFYETYCAQAGGSVRLTVVATNSSYSQSTLAGVLNLTPATTASATFNASMGALNVTSLGAERDDLQVFWDLPVITAGEYCEAEVSCSGGGKYDALLQHKWSPYDHYDDRNRSLPCDGVVRKFHFYATTSDTTARLSIMPRDTGAYTFTYVRWRRVL